MESPEMDIEKFESPIEIDEPIRITKDNTKINGDNTKIKPQFDGSAIIIDGTKNVGIENIIIEHKGGKSRNKSNGIEVREAKNTLIKNCDIYNTPKIGSSGTKEAIGGGSGICVRSDAVGTTIQNCSIWDCGWRGIEIGGHQTLVEGCSCRGQLDRGISGDVQLPNTDQEFDENATQLTIRNSILEGGKHPAAPIGFTRASQVRISNCKTDNKEGRRGISARESSQVVIRNCDLKATGEDPQEGIFSTSEGCKVIGNNIQGFEYGVRMTGQKSKICGNTIANSQYSILNKAGGDIVINNNIIINQKASRLRTLLKRARLYARKRI